MGQSIPVSAQFTAGIVGPQSRIRVLVVDDSVVVRRLLSQALSQDPAVDVTGAAPNGAIALQRLAQSPADVVTLDVEMPEMDGLETLKRVRREFPQVRVIMCSTLTERGATTTLDALSLGAHDYITKPSHTGLNINAMTAELLRKIKQFFPTTAVQPEPIPISTGRARTVTAGNRQGEPPLAVVIGVSTGGPTALAQVLPELPGNFPLPIFIVQHMPPLFTNLLAARLRARSSLAVEEATEGRKVGPGLVLLAPGGFHMRLRKVAGDVHVALDEGSLENSCRPAVDPLFCSAEEVYGGRLVGVVLTGMGRDGLRGSEVLKSRGAHIIVQDQASSVVWGMPGAVANAHLADEILPLSDISKAILRRLDRRLR